MEFRVKALDASGGVVRIAIDAGDEAEARRLAADRDLVVLNLRRAGRFSGLKASAGTRFDLVLFSRELVSLLDTGLSLVEAIETLAEQESASAGGGVPGELRRLLYRGECFSRALEQLPRHFPPLYVLTVRAAEETGDVKESLTRYLAYQAQIDQFRRRIATALIYPGLLLAVGGLVMTFMMFYVVPRFSSIYLGMGGDLPFSTRLLIEWGQLVGENAIAALTAVAGLIGVTVLAAGHMRLRRSLGHLSWRLPALGQRLRTYELARFYRTLGMLLKSGMPLPKAIDMAGTLLSPILRLPLESAARDVRAGSSVSSAFARHDLTTPIARRLLGLGEQSGRMAEMVDRTATFYEDELTRWVDWFMLLFEPALMVLIGAVIGTILVLLYLPIFELAEIVK